jgi:hypothetical protein
MTIHLFAQLFAGFAVLLWLFQALVGYFYEKHPRKEPDKAGR